jgi:hypothetical protein
MRHLGKKRLPYVKKNCLFREKNMSITTFSEKKRLNLRFPTLLSFSISLTGPIPLRIQFLLLLPKRKIFILFLFYAPLSLSPFVRVPLSLSFSFYARSWISRKKKEKLMMWLSHSMICSALFCYRVSFCQLVVDCSFCLRLS